MKVLEIPLTKIKTGDRLRKLDTDYADFLALSMGERGLTNPITVGKADKKGNYILLAGMHRYSAALKLEWTAIAAIVDPNDDHLHQTLIEIDENLFRRDLSALDRAVCLERRQEIFEILHPETKAGLAGALVKNELQTKNFSFAKRTAEKLGLTPRSIQQYVRRAKQISPDVRDQISNTWIANNGTALDSLVKLTSGEQLEVVTLLLRPEALCKNVASALLEISGDQPKKLTADEQQLDALLRAWAKAKPKVRQQFLSQLKELEVI